MIFVCAPRPARSEVSGNGNESSLWRARSSCVGVASCRRVLTALGRSLGGFLAAPAAATIHLCPAEHTVAAAAAARTNDHNSRELASLFGGFRTNTHQSDRQIEREMLACARQRHTQSSIVGRVVRLRCHARPSDAARLSFSRGTHNGTLAAAAAAPKCGYASRWLVSLLLRRCPTVELCRTLLLVRARARAIVKLWTMRTSRTRSAG